jgi:beta-glucanase (GH16 family)
MDGNSNKKKGKCEKYENYRRGNIQTQKFLSYRGGSYETAAMCVTKNKSIMYKFLDYNG